MVPLTTLFRNVSQVIPLHFDHANLLMVNLIFLYCQHKSVIWSARNSLVKPSGISTLVGHSGAIDHVVTEYQTVNSVTL